MLSYHKDKVLKIEYDPVNNKHAFSRNAVGAHSFLEISEADYVHSNSNSIYVSNTSGNDSTGNGTQLNPYKTILKGMDSCNASAMKVIVLDSFLYVENISAMTNIFFQGIYADTGETPKLSLRQYDNNYVPDDTNTIFVSDLTGSDSDAGTESSPVKTIEKAITLLSAAIQNILIIDSSTYYIDAFEFKDNVKNLRSLIGEKPVIKINYESVVSTKDQTAFRTVAQATGHSSNCVLRNDDFVIAYDGLTYGSWPAGIRISDKSGTVKYSIDFGSNMDGVLVAPFNDGFIFSFNYSDGSASGVQIRNADGSVAYSISLGSTYWRHTKIIPISSTRFAITFNYADGSNNGYVMLFNDALSQIGSTTLIANSYSYQNTEITGTVLSDGNFVICFKTGSGTYGKIFNASLSQVGGDITIEGVVHYALSCEKIGIDKWVISYCESLANKSVKFKILTNTGTILYSGTLPSGVLLSGTYYTTMIWIIPIGNNSFGISYTTTGNASKIHYYYLNRLLKINNVSSMSLAYYNGYDGAYAYGTRNYSRFSDGSLIYCYDPYYKIIKAPNYLFSVLTDIKINGIEFDLDNVTNLESLFTSIDSEIEFYNVSMKNAKNAYPLDTDSLPATIINSNDRVKIRNSYFKDSDVGVNTVSNFLDIQDSIFVKIGRGYAVFVDGAAASTGDIIIEHNTFFDGYGAIKLDNNSGTDKEVIKNNILHENDLYEIFAENAQSYSYCCLSGLNSENVSQGAMVILANPLFENDGNYNPDETNLHLRLRFIGFKVDSPAVGLSDDGRNAGAYDDIYIGELQTWNIALISKPKKIEVNLEPVGAIANISHDGAVDTSVESFVENVVLQYDSIILSDFEKFKSILLCKKSEVRLYPDPLTYPQQFNIYKIYFDKSAGSPDFFIQSDIGVHGFAIKLSRKYE